METLIRPIEPDEWPAACEVTRTVFGERPSEDKEQAEAAILPMDRVLVAHEPGGGIVASVASYPFELTLPGGTGIASAGITNAGVLPTHRRRGLLRALMKSQLDDVAARGEPLALLNASEAAIYGRFGYGLASRYAARRVRPERAHFVVDGSVRPVRMNQARYERDRLVELYEATRSMRPGTVSRSDQWWDMLLGPVRMWKGGGHFEVALVEPEGQDPGGYALYSMAPPSDGDWFTLEIRELVASTPATYAALWRFLVHVDLVSTITADVPTDDLLPWMLTDCRAAETTQLRDFLFVRVLDSVAALTARRYSQEIDLVLEVHDDFRPEGAASGRYRLTGGPDGAVCERTGSSADVSMGVAELGSLLLGGVRAGWLHDAGRLEVNSPVAVAALDRAFPWSPEPFCATRF